MKPLEFRAWTGKQMIYQEKQYLASFIRRVVSQIIFDHGGEFRQHESYLPNGSVIDDYLMQYTGLTDKNGKKIFEGDIIEVTHKDGYESVWLVEPIGSLERDGQYYGLCVSSDGDGDNYFIDQSILLAGEIIGNIYENPELMKHNDTP